MIVYKSLLYCVVLIFAVGSILLFACIQWSTKDHNLNTDYNTDQIRILQHIYCTMTTVLIYLAAYVTSLEIIIMILVLIDVDGSVS